jgi:hypothetical protein
MLIRIVSRCLCLGLLAIGLSGCAAKVTVTSNRVPDYHGEIRRLLVIAQVGGELGYGEYNAERPAFRDAIVNSLSKCGITANVQFQSQISLPAETAQAVRAFAPDTALTIETKSTSIGGGSSAAVYIGTVIDMPRRKPVWKAEIQYIGGKSGDEILAASIIDRLKSDAILNALCPTPAVPKSGV